MFRNLTTNLTVSFSHPPTACDVAADSPDTWAAS
jgi:hypothetical protein